jgi:type I restriction enzyme S subunit
MALNRRLGEYLEICDIRNVDNGLGEQSVRGIATSKAFISTKANLQGVSLTSYKVVFPKMFAYVPDTSRRGNKISLAYNDSNEMYLVSSISIVFKVKEELTEELLPEYLNIIFNRREFDRYARFNSWGSAREAFSWMDFCDTAIAIPSLEIQKKYANIYYGIWENLDSVEQSVKQLNKAQAIVMDKIKREAPHKKLGDYISVVTEKNTEGQYGIESVRGVSNTKEIQKTKANVSNRDLTTFYIIRKNQFVFNRRTTRNGERLGLGFNDSDEVFVFTEDYVAFEVIDQNVINPSFLYMYFKRDEFDRYVRYNSWGSATEFFNWEDMQEVMVPIPDMQTQNAVVAIHQSLKVKVELIAKLREKLNMLCPILIKGAIEEGGR